MFLQTERSVNRSDWCDVMSIMVTIYQYITEGFKVSVKDG